MQTGELKIMQPQALHSSPGPSDFFTGRVVVASAVRGEDPSCMSCVCVTFDPSARSAWHNLPKGQLLVVLEGTGLIQQWGKAVQKTQKGDVIWTPPGVKHWHGANGTTRMAHLAIQESLNGKAVNWMEKVSDEEYGKGETP